MGSMEERLPGGGPRGGAKDSWVSEKGLSSVETGGSCGGCLVDGTGGGPEGFNDGGCEAIARLFSAVDLLCRLFRIEGGIGGGE
jgi:hypothetical protein